MAPSELVDDAVAEILLRLPPDEPACLVRATLVCKPWRRIVSDPSFPRRYREFHRAPPLLGFLHNSSVGPRFTPTTALPCTQPAHGYCQWRVVDCRHGRVLLHRWDKHSLLVWDPVSGGRRRLRGPEFLHHPFFSGAVLCAIDGCSHLDCHNGPFLVVFIDNVYPDRFTRAWVYSSETAAWSAPASARFSGCSSYTNRGVLVRGEIYFTRKLGARILKYDLCNHCLALIDPPPMSRGATVLMPTADGSLGLIGVKGSSLYLWSRKVNPNLIAEWLPYRVIELQKLICIYRPGTLLNVIGFAEDVGVIFVTTNIGAFIIEVNSGRVTKIGNSRDFNDVFPFLSFYTPDRGGLSLPARFS
ncbi:unnamed protein product [Urochloa decumbens]|uniref:F-box domain-containing protein n=1 Tax=Urochloa decumbens TaxID=240449 RepID=A0ABC9FND7_9POAL